jgi:L-lactate dehydrogenase
MPSINRHICIIGAGLVGSSIAYTIMLKGWASKISLIDINQQRAEGEAIDLAHGIWGTETGTVRAGDYSDCSEADIIVITAGAAQKPGQTRLDLASQNTKILRSIIKSLGKINSSCKVIIVANPVDVLTTVAKRELGLPANQIMGSGTFLDTSRLKYLISQEFKTNPKNIHAYVLGEHGDSSFCPWSVATLSGAKLDLILSDAKQQQLFNQVQHAAYDIVAKKGSTYYGIAVAVAEIVEAIVNDQKLIIPVSTIPGQFYGSTGVCVGVPSIIGANGIEEVWELQLTETEKGKLLQSIGVISDTIAKI